jgi:Flp pilus assembly protein TadG
MNATRRERGASAIEFSLVFPLFFLLLYGLVTYGLIFGLQQAMTAAAEDGARAAVACDPTDVDGHGECVVARARQVVGASLAWLPADRRQTILGADNAAVEVAVESDPDAGARVRVRVLYPNYASDPLLPVLRLPGLGAIPPVPDQLVAVAVALL